MAEKKPLKITETVLRDAHQSLIATRMTTEQMLPIVDKMDKIGYHAVECWGGATFDASLRFLKEDPWARLRKLRDGFKNTKLQMLFRGQNILGYRPYADDVVEYFVKKSAANGIDVIRIFDCLNDIRNLETAVKAANSEGVEAQVALSYTLGDAYTLDYWKDMAKKIEDMGANSICIKDMAGLLVPYKATELVQALKEGTSLPIDLHTHYTSGVASMTYLKAVEAGCDRIDTAMSPMAMGTSQPATEVLAKTFEGTPYDPGFDQNLLAEIAAYFTPLREEWIKSGLMSTKVMGVNIKTLLYQVPGGMLSNLVSQLKEMKAEDKFTEVLEEVPRVRKDFGEPPLVTPSSQIVGTQAVLNVVLGERYKNMTKESKDLLLGKYGKTVKPFNPEVQKKAIELSGEQPITCRFADTLKPELAKLESEMKQYKQQDDASNKSGEGPTRAMLVSGFFFARIYGILFCKEHHKQEESAWRITAPSGAQPSANMRRRRAASLRSSRLQTARKRPWPFWSRCARPTAPRGTTFTPTACGRATGSATPTTANRPRQRGRLPWRSCSTAD